MKIFDCLLNSLCLNTQTPENCFEIENFFFTFYIYQPCVKHVIFTCKKTRGVITIRSNRMTLEKPINNSNVRMCKKKFFFQFQNEKILAKKFLMKPKKFFQKFVDNVFLLLFSRSHTLHFFSVEIRKSISF